MDVRQLKILAIDDKKDNLTSLQAVLTDALPGCAFFTALNGADGIVLAHAEDPDVILLDIVMPGMDGYAVCTTLKADDELRTIPVIFLTALRTDRASRMKALDVGADGFLAKPLDESELLAQIRTMAKLKVANGLQRLGKEQLATLVVERTALLESATVALRASEAQYRSVFTESRVVKLLVDPVDGRIVEGNCAACEYYGWGQAQLQTICIQDINTLAAEDVLAEMEQARLRGKTHFDFRHRLANGDVRDVEVYSSPVPAAEPDGRVLLYSIVHDVTERRRAEAQLAQSHKLLANLARLVPSAIYQYRLYPDGHSAFPYANPGITTIYEVTPEEVRDDATPVFGRLHPEDAERVGRLIMDSARTLEEFYCEFRVVLPRQGLRWRWSQAHPERTADGGTLWHGIISDITERKQAESELRTRARALEQSPASVVITDHQGNIEYVNPRFEHVSGYTQAEVVGQNPRLLKSGKTSTATYTELWQTISAGGEWRGELCNRRKNGELFWEFAAISGLVDENGRVGHYIAVKEDITERKRAEDQLRASEARLADAQEGAGIGSWETDLVDLGVVWSDETYRIFGVARDSFQASHPAFLAFVHPDDRAAVDAAFAESLTSLSRHVIEHRIVTPEGQVKFVEERWRVVQDALQRPVRAVGTCHDITARREADAARMSLQQQLNQSQKLESIGLLAGGVAHDFNNQLAVILGYSEVTMLKLGSEHAAHADIEEIRRAAQHSVELTRQLLAFARKQTLSPRVLDLNDAVDGMLKMLRRLLGERVTLKWTPESGLWKVAVDPTQLDQVLANLAVNAKSAMRDGDGVVQVSTANVVLGAPSAAPRPGVRAGEFVCLRVHDNGSGMDDVTLSRIFEPFFTTKGLGEGTGLGLSTLLGIVEQHGGFVEVESTLGVGTTFALFFPRVTAPVEEIAAPALPFGRGTETILLVEDEDGVRVAAAEMLRLMGYTVLMARGGDEAAALSASHAAPIHLLLTDVIMPGLNGVQIRDRLLTSYPELKVLFMSGYPDDVVATEGVLESGIHFMQKPFTMHTLAIAIRRVLDA